MFLDLSYDEAKRKGQLRNKAELVEAIVHGAVTVSYTHLTLPTSDLV